MKSILAILGVALCAFTATAQSPILRTQFTTNSSTVVISALTADASPDGAADYIITLDASATALKKVLLNNLPGSGTGEANVGANLGIGYPIYANKTGVTLNLNTFTNNPTYLTVSSNANTFTWTFANSVVTNMALLNGVNTWSGIQTFSAIPVVPNDSFALGTKTTGNYAAGDAEAGNALAGDSATLFFSSGTLEDARLSSNVPLINGTNTWTGTQNFTLPTILTNLGNTISGNGAGLTNLSAASVNGTVGAATNASTVTIVDGSDTTSHVLISDSPTGNLPVKTDANLGYNAGIGQLSAVSYLGSGAGLTVDATAFSGNLTTSTTNLQLVANALDAIAAGAGAPLNGTNHWTGPSNIFDGPLVADSLIVTNGISNVGTGMYLLEIEGAVVDANNTTLSAVEPTGVNKLLLPDIPGTNTLAVVSQLSTAVTNYWSVVNAGIGYGLDTNSVDNTAAIQAAINNATNDIGFAGATFGKRVFIPAGLYNVDGSLNIYPGITLEGEASPKGTGTRFYKNTTGPLMIVHNPGAVAIRHISGLSDAIGTGAIGIVSSTNGTLIADLEIENVHFRNFASGVVITNAQDIRIKGGGTAITVTGYKLGPGVHNVTLDGVAVAGGTGAVDGVLVNGTTSTEVAVRNSSFRITLTYGVRVTNNAVGGVSGMRVQNNEFEGLSYGLYALGTTAVMDGVLAAGNTFRSIGTNIYASFVYDLATVANRSTGNQPMLVMGSVVRGWNSFADSWPSSASTPTIGTTDWGVQISSNVVVAGSGIVTIGGTVSAARGMTNTGVSWNYTASPSSNSTTNWTVGFGGGTNAYQFMEFTQTNNIFFQYSTNRAPVRSLVLKMNSGGGTRTNTLNASWKLLDGLTTPFYVTNGTSAILSLTCFAGGDVGVSETNVVAAVAYHAN